MKMFRAVKKNTITPDEPIFPRLSTRLPVNVPYLVDNIWEALRPDGCPSRRQAIYASPTIELAIEGASSTRPVDPSKFDVFEVDFCGFKPKIAQIGVPDARDHDDVRALMVAVPNLLSKNFAEESIEVKRAFSHLYLPGVSKAELNAFFPSSEKLSSVLKELQTISTFWQESTSYPDPTKNGELFFTLEKGEYYCLRKFL